MSSIGRWKNIFGHREKVAVNIGGKTEMLTDTQSFRFEEISKPSDAAQIPSYRNPLEDSHYRLADAAARLMIEEDDLLANAAAGRLDLYIDVAGTSGQWHRRDPEGNVSQSSVTTIRCGWLKLRAAACADLARQGQAIVHALDLHRTDGFRQPDSNDNTLANLQAWGPGEKQFFPLEPLTIDRDKLILLPPLRN